MTLLSLHCPILKPLSKSLLMVSSRSSEYVAFLLYQPIYSYRAASKDLTERRY